MATRGMELSGEAIILFNTILNVVIVRFVGQVCLMELRKWIVLLAAFSSSVVAIILLPSIWSIILSYFILLIPLAKQRHFLKGAIILWITVFFVGGMLSFIQQTIKLSISNVLLLLIASMSLYSLNRFARSWHRERVTMKFVRQAEVQLFNQTFTLQSYIDSGNHCEEVFSGKPVHFIIYETIEQLLPADFKAALAQWNEQHYADVSMFSVAIQKQLRLVPYKTVSSKQMMLVFPCTIRLEGQEVLQHYVALTKQTTLFPGNCSMLMHVSMLDYL